MSDSSLAAEKARLLMCRPDYFGVEYLINPWMEGNVGRIDSRMAQKQWSAFYAVLNSLADVELIDPAPGLPDMVFTANAGVILDNEVALSSFAHLERHPEEKRFAEWFGKKGFNVHKIPRGLLFEGAGDAIIDITNGWLLAAYGNRTSLEAHPYLSSALNIEVLSLRLVDSRFYHLDTCLFVAPGGYIVYHPGAFDTVSNRLIESLYPKEKRITIKDEDAAFFPANSVCAGKTIVMSHCPAGLAIKLSSIGFTVVEAGLSEFIKAGGAAKSLTLALNDRARKNRAAGGCKVSTRSVQVQGQIVDSRLMSRICGAIVDSGGSFQIKEFYPGQKHKETYTAEIDITGRDRQAVDNLVLEITRLGASASPGAPSNAVMQGVARAGVAPDNFYCTTIYPTKVRVGGKWIDVLGRRGNGVIVVSGATAKVKLIRDLDKGELVVIGGDGIKTSRHTLKRSYEDHFGLMGDGASGEWRVELAIERVAWEMERIKSREGVIVVVAGPEVVHTGGAPHLAWMAQNGYVGALLGGNAIAAHDIELAISGACMGRGIAAGKSLEGGDRNHIAAINRVRKHGSIAKIIEAGELKSGLFYELIKNNVPFCLAGSVEDDGPLPETRMDIIRAQADYARIVRRADMILMLSGGPRATGAGAMAPAGVKMVCVDINPAVVAGLITGRGSLESIGVVTDVGLFLSLLHGRLSRSPRLSQRAL